MKIVRLELDRCGKRRRRDVRNNCNLLRKGNILNQPPRRPAIVLDSPGYVAVYYVGLGLSFGISRLTSDRNRRDCHPHSFPSVENTDSSVNNVLVIS